jgi:predicted Zn-dependent protease
LGTILAKRGDYSAATNLWEGALIRSPANDVARINLANAYLRQGDHSAAERAILEALEFQPDFPQARQLLLDVRRKTRP